MTTGHLASIDLLCSCQIIPEQGETICYDLAGVLLIVPVETGAPAYQ